MTIFLLLSVNVTRKNWALTQKYLSLFLFILMIWDTSHSCLYNASLRQIRFSNVLQKVRSLNEIIAVYCIVIWYLFPYNSIYYISWWQHSVIFFINSFAMEHHLWESIHIIRFSFLFKYCLHAEITPPNMGARQGKTIIILGFSCIRKPWLWGIIQ